MKAIITLVFILFVGISSQAQNVKSTSDKEVIKDANFTEATITNKNSVARLYKNKNHRVIKALSFSTKKNKSKLA